MRNSSLRTKQGRGLKGFTLIEIIVTLVIVSVVATLAFRQYSAVMEKQECMNTKQNVLLIYSYLKAYEVKVGTFDPLPDYSLSLADINAALGLNIQDDALYQLTAMGSMFFIQAERNPGENAYSILATDEYLHEGNPICYSSNFKCPSGCP